MPNFFSDVDLVFFLGFFSGCGMRVNQIILLLLIAIHFKNVDGFSWQRIGITNFLEVCFLSHSLI